MQVNQLSIESQKKILKNVLNCMNYIQFLTSVDDYLNEKYSNNSSSIFTEHVKDYKAELIIINAIEDVLESDVNIRISRYNPQGLSYASDCHLHYSILINDKKLVEELIAIGATIDKEEIQLAAKHGRACILEILLNARPDFDRNNIKIPAIYDPTRFFWAPAQNYLGYEADYAKIEKLLESETRHLSV